MSSTPAIETEHLRKEFGGRPAVADLSLTVERGEVFGFLGPNGAGKTTSIKMLLGLVAPTSGTARLLGEPVTNHRVRGRVGFLPEHFRFHEWQTGNEFMAFHAALFHIPRAKARTRIAELLELVGLTAHRDKRLRFYSKGMLQRVGLAQALLAEPEIVFLDEPTSGLDPGGRHLVRGILRDLSRAGTTVFLNSHLLSEIERVCHRVAFVRQGEVVRMGTLASFAEGSIDVEARVKGITPEILAGLETWAHGVSHEDGRIRFMADDDEGLPHIHRYLVERGVEVYSLEPHPPSLEDVFLRVVGRSGDTQ